MFKIEGLTNDAKQELTISSPSGEELSLNLFYSENQLNWFLSLDHPRIKLNSINLNFSFNILNQYSTMLDFGIACLGESLFFKDSFTNSLGASLFILNENEIKEFDSFLKDPTEQVSS